MHVYGYTGVYRDGMGLEEPDGPRVNVEKRSYHVGFTCMLLQPACNRS